MSVSGSSGSGRIEGRRRGAGEVGAGPAVLDAGDRRGEDVGRAAGTTPVRSCDEAGRDGFWRRRSLAAERIGAWVDVNEFFGWRPFRNRKEVGAAAGLTPTPYQSGEDSREQEISRTGIRLRP